MMHSFTPALDTAAPIIHELEEKFLSSQEMFPDMPGVSISMRYAAVRGVLRDETRGLRLYEDQVVFFMTAERYYAGSRLFAAYEFASLQAWFWGMVKANRLCRIPAGLYVTSYLDFWKRRLADRFDDTLPWRRPEDDRLDALHSPHVPETVTVYPWRMN